MSPAYVARCIKASHVVLQRVRYVDALLAGSHVGIDGTTLTHRTTTSDSSSSTNISPTSAAVTGDAAIDGGVPALGYLILSTHAAFESRYPGFRNWLRAHSPSPGP
jgi:hypothetical protein